MKIDWEKLKHKVVDINPVYLDDDIPNKRMSICKSCEYYVENPIKKCSNCGCLLEPKVRAKFMNCPIKKW